MGDVDGVDILGKLEFEPASDEEPGGGQVALLGMLSLGLSGPRTLPSFGYSQVRLQRMQHLHAGALERRNEM